jgi:hypothetical protein
VLREVSDNFALAELQNSPVLAGPREPVLRAAGKPQLEGRVEPALDARREQVLSTMRLRPGRTELRPDTKPLSGGDGPFDELGRRDDFTNMVPV